MIILTKSIIKRTTEERLRKKMFYYKFGQKSGNIDTLNKSALEEKS